MNRIYSLVFNRALRQVQVVSEHAQHRLGSEPRRVATRGAVPVIAGLATALALAAIPLSVSGQTLPGGDVIRGGIDNITTTPAGDTMVIDQGNHLRGLIDWATFDIGEDYTVRFDQLADAVALNVIGDVNPSQIYGNLEATGTVFLINPNGIIFGDTASVNVGGLIASTLEVDGNVFLDGGDGIAMTSSGIPASITNDGVIVATGAQGVTLLGGHLSSTGIITAETGSINLLGTQTATLSFGTGNRLSIAVDEALTAVHNEPAVVHNNGVLNADGGRVFMHANVASGVLSNAVNHAGIITASGIDADGNGGVVLSGGGSGVVQSGSITSGADALITAEGAVSLDGDSLDVTGLTVDAGSLSLASDLGVAGNLSITVADGGISQSGAWQVGGTSTLDAGSGQIRLDNAGNDFLGAVNLTGGEVSIQDKNALGLGALDVGSLAVRTQSALGLGSGVIGGDLVAVSNGGNITQSTGGLQVGGTSDLDAGLGGISLGQAGNRFDGSVQLNGHAVTIASDFDLDLGTLDVGSLGASSGGSVTFGGGSVNGSLGVTSGGDISQTGAITVGGVSTLVAQDGSITLADSGNDFAGVVNLDSDGAAEIGSTGTLTLGTVNARSLDASSTDIELHEDIQTGGDQRYAGAVRLAADVALASGAGDVAFEGSVDGTHALTVEAAAGAATFGGPVGTTTVLASLAADAGSVSIGNRLVVFGDLALTAATGGIAQGAAWQVGGTGMLDAGTDVITLTQVGNDFVGAVHLAGGDVSIQDVDELILGTLDVGTLDATSVGALNLGSGGIDGTLVAQSNNGAITQSGALDITGTSTLNAGTGSISLDIEDNRFGDAVTATGNGITLVGSEDLAIAGLTFQPGPDHGIRLEAGGTLTLPGESIDTGPASLTLASHGGELVTAGVLRGASVTLTGADGIRLGHNVAATEGLLESGAHISQLDGVLHMDSLHVDADGSVWLGAENQVEALGNVNVQGGFSLRNVRAITQVPDTSAWVAGDASFSSEADITLMNPGNHFGGSVDLTGGAAAISGDDGLRLGNLAVDSLVALSGGALDLGRGNIGGDLEATSSGDIGQSGALTVEGATTLVAGGDGAISLDDGGNRFDGLVTLTGGAADIVASDTLELGPGEIRGNLQATSIGGDIDQSGALVVDGVSSFSAAGGAIDLGDDDNHFGGTVDLTAGGDVVINARDALALGALAVGSLEATSDGALNLGQGNIEGNLAAYSKGGAIGQTGALTVGGTSNLDAGSSAITLEQSNRFSGRVDLSGGATVIRDSGALTLGAVEVSSLHVTSGGALDLGTAIVSGDLGATSGAGGITQSGRLEVGGHAELDAGAGDIILLDAGNDFVGTLAIEGGAVSVFDRNTLRLGTVEASSLDVTATAISLSRNITTDGDQAYHGDVTLDAAVALDSAQGDIGFDSTVDGRHALEVTALGTVTFAGAVGGADPLAGLTVDAGQFDAQSTLDTSGDLLLTVGQGGIGQAGRWDVAGTTALHAAGDITLDEADNAFAGMIDVTGRATTIVNSGALTLRTVDVASLDATSHGDLDLGQGDIDGSLVARSNGGDIGQSGALQVGGASDLDAAGGAIALTDEDNSFGGVMDLAGGVVSIRGADGLVLGSVDAASLQAGSGGALNLGAGTIAGDLDATSGAGGISQGGALEVGGDMNLAAGNGAIVLDDAGNDFAGLVHLAGGAVTIVDQGALVLADGLRVASLDATSGGDLDLGGGRVAGDLAARSNGGAIGQSGALDVGGASTVDAGNGAITLDDAGNDFAGPVHLTGGATSIADAGSLALGALDVASLTATSQGDLGLGGGRIRGDLVARSSDGAIGQSGALRIAGTSTLAAGGGAIVLDDMDNDFVGAVEAAGTGLALSSAGDLIVTSLDNRGHGVSLIAGGRLVLPAQSINTGTAGLRLAALGSALSTRGALSGGDVSLQGGSGITLADDVTALGTLALESGGGVTSSGVLAARTLTGRIGGTAALGEGNAISRLGAFSAEALELGSTGSLMVTGPVEAGSRLELRVGGDLDIHGLLSAGEMRLNAAGAIGSAGAGRVVADTLSGSAGGPTWLGDRERFVDNRVAAVGDFTSPAGFSMTNRGSLTLTPVGDSEYSIDAGSSAMYLSVVDGDLLQEGTVRIRNGRGFYASTGHIGLADAPIHVVAVDQQTVEAIGRPPAYFHVTRADGTLLPVVGANAVNVPMSVVSSRVQRASHGEVEYVDLGADASDYRAYGIVQPGLRLPDDQQPECDPDFPDPECIDA